MPFIRFYRRIPILPGVHLNISKGGLSLSIGKRGWSLTFGRHGLRLTKGLPGTGLFISEHVSYERFAGFKQTEAESEPERDVLAKYVGGSHGEKKGDGGGLIILLVLGILVLVALAMPVVLPIGFLVCWVTFTTQKSHISNSMSDFWLNPNEKAQFKDSVGRLESVVKIINDANNSAIEAGIQRNQDGSFSARSNLGKEVRRTLEYHEPLKESLMADLDELQERPLFRWQAFSKVVASLCCHERPCP